MAQLAFLDTGVVLAYCFKDDKHHMKCRSYVVDHDHEKYISDHVEQEYIRKEPTLAERHADGIFDHISRLRKSDYEGQLDSMDLSQIRQNLIRGGNPSARTLHEFYSDGPQFILVDDLIDRLRDLARDIEQNALENRKELMAETETWTREVSYPDIDGKLSVIHEEDRRICLDAHDLAVSKREDAELATTNPKDLVRDGHRELILDATDLQDVISLAVTN